MVARLTRISSLGGIASAAAAPISAFVLLWLPTANVGSLTDLLSRMARGLALMYAMYALATTALIVVFQHRANIARIRAGTEPRIGDNA